MSFDNSWEKTYSENNHMSIWPWSDLVSYVMRYAKPKSNSFKVLELGCGAGANIEFFKRLDCDYYGIDGSKFIISNLKHKFPELKNNLIAGDFTEDLYFNNAFDLIIDRASVTHNTTDSIFNCLKLINNKLNKNGKFIGIDWFSTMHSDYKLGFKVKDKYTINNFQKGQFIGVGNVHFSNKKHLIDLLSSFKIIILEHKIIKKEVPDDKHIFASWNLVAEKI